MQSSIDSIKYNLKRRNNKSAAGQSRLAQVKENQKKEFELQQQRKIKLPRIKKLGGMTPTNDGFRKKMIKGSEVLVRELSNVEN